MSAFAPFADFNTCALGSTTNLHAKAPTWFTIGPAVREKWFECIPIGTNFNNLLAALTANLDVDANVFQEMQPLVQHHRDRWGNEAGDDTTTATPPPPIAASALPPPVAAANIPKIISTSHSGTKPSSRMTSSQPKAATKTGSAALAAGGASASASSSTAASATTASPGTSTGLWTRGEILTLLRVWREAAGSCHLPTNTADFREVVHAKFCAQHSSSNAAAAPTILCATEPASRQRCA